MALALSAYRSPALLLAAPMPIGSPSEPSPLVFGERCNFLPPTHPLASTHTFFRQRYVQEHQVLVHKLLELQDFSIYADTDRVPWVNLVGRPWDLKERFAMPLGGA